MISRVKEVCLVFLYNLFPHFLKTHLKLSWNQSIFGISLFSILIPVMTQILLHSLILAQWNKGKQFTLILISDNKSDIFVINCYLAPFLLVSFEFILNWKTICSSSVGMLETIDIISHQVSKKGTIYIYIYIYNGCFLR